jgi:hypothetical protein
VENEEGGAEREEEGKWDRNPGERANNENIFMYVGMEEITEAASYCWVARSECTVTKRIGNFRRI